MSTWKLQHWMKALKNKSRNNVHQKAPEYQKWSWLAEVQTHLTTQLESFFFPKETERIHNLKTSSVKHCLLDRTFEKWKANSEFQGVGSLNRGSLGAPIISASYDFLCCEKRLGLCVSLLWESNLALRGLGKRQTKTSFQHPSIFSSNLLLAQP